MRITFLIDSLSSGGAQRQMSLLAALMKGRGHEARVLFYHPFDFFRKSLEDAGVPAQFVRHRGKAHRIFAVSRAIRSGKPDAVVAFLQTPGIIAELSGLLGRNYAVIVSERNTEPPGPMDLTRRTALRLHHLADAVVSNSCAQERALRRLAPGIMPRVRTIRNCVDLDHFRPPDSGRTSSSEGLRILSVGRFQPQKNYPRLLNALEIINRRHPGIPLKIDVYGNDFFINGKPGPQAAHFLEFKETHSKSPSREHFRIHRPVEDVVSLYHQATALCLPSLFEGCSNVICEAMACGRPVLASRVGDNPLLVEDGVNGFLFDPGDPEDIADSLVRFSRLSCEEQKKMGEEGRGRAERMLSPQRFAGEYEDLLTALVNGEPLP